MKCALLLAAMCAVTLAMPFPVYKKDNVADSWAVIVAGSNNFYNYRHQSDVYHALNILKKGGYPDNRIIMMHYDDIAENSQNPDKGVVINRPNGPNVYEAVKAFPKSQQYTGKEVTPDNFIAVITGDKTKASGAVLESGPNDHVFINFVDHGGVGLIGFPSEFLYAKDLNAALVTMKTKNMYKQLVFYMEACESGSMFEGQLSTTTEIFATTAANAHESSYACYLDQHLNTYLGDVYSVNWMENTDATGFTETLEQQYNIVKQKTNTSHVMQYGDVDFDNESIGEFLKYPTASEILPDTSRVAPTATINDAVDSRDATLAILRNRHAQAVSAGASDVHVHETAVRNELLRRELLFMRIMGIATGLVGEERAVEVLQKKVAPSNWDCYKASLEGFMDVCGRLDGYGMKFVNVFTNLCDAGVSPTAVIARAKNACQ